MSLDSFLKSIREEDKEKQKQIDAASAAKEAEDQAFLKQAYEVFNNTVPKSFLSSLRTLERNGYNIYPNKQHVTNIVQSKEMQQSFSFDFKSCVIQIDAVIAVNSKSIDFYYTHKRKSSIPDHMQLDVNHAIEYPPKRFLLNELNAQIIDSTIEEIITEISSKCV
jgi:hypothetical protein